MKSAPYLFYDKKGAGNGGPGPPNKSLVTTGPPTLPEGATSLHFALGTMKRPELEMLLRENPDVVHEKGFNGQSPLHKAVLGNDPDVVDLLLRYKADPNFPNNFYETPLHFACKRGLPIIIHLLLENGADINLVDTSGKGPIHHVTHGGSVFGLHFLTEVHKLSTHIRDLNLSTPLHVVAAHGHVEALNYLLRKDRCDLLSVNVHANNALHIAANAGHGWTCWRILEEGGLELLHQTNREGNTPLDLAKKNKDIKYRETITLLTYYHLNGKKTGRAPGPVQGWYCHAALPLLFYPLVILIANMTPRPGPITLAGVIIMLAILYLHTHRMKHITRWPNPVFFGMFLAGSLHSSVCFYIEIVPYIYTDHMILVGSMILWNILFYYLYYVLLTKDPGRATESATKPGSLWSYGIMDVADGTLKPEAFCTTCEIIPPRLSHHCKLCVQCYLQTDHHCLFLYRCVAKHNHRLFVIFVGLVSLGMTMLLTSMIYYYGYLYSGRALSKELFQDIFEYNPWTWTVFLSNFVSIFWGLNLLKYQLVVVSKAQTTVYQPNGGRTNLTWKQRVLNVVYFLRGLGHYASDEQIDT